MSASRLLLAAAHALVWSAALPYFCGYIATFDLWSYLSQGQLTWEQLQIPRHDTFSYLPTTNWICHYWLTGALTYPLFMAGGGAACRALTLFLLLGAAVIAYSTARREGASPLVTLVVVALAIPSISVGAMPFRPAMLSFVYIALLIRWLNQTGPGNNLRWWIGGLFVLWANTHAGVPAGLIIIGIYMVAAWREPSRMKHLFWLGVLAAAATLMTPYHINYWKMVYEILGDANKDITEWQPVRLLSSDYVEFQLLIALAVAILAAARERDLRRWLILALFAWMGLKQIRQIPLFGYAAIAILPPVLEQLIAPLRKRWSAPGSSVLKTAVPFTAALSAALIAAMWFQSEPWKLMVPAIPNAGGTHYPVGATEFLKLNDLKGNVAVDFSWGAYAAWKLRNHNRVSADGRHVTVFTRDAVEMCLDFTKGRTGWKRVLEEYPTDYAIVSRGSRIEQNLQNERGWTLLYSDPGATLFAKRANLPQRPLKQPPQSECGTFP